MVEEGPIILFDAQCVLCSANAQFILRHDRLGVEAQQVVHRLIEATDGWHGL